jgi:hypothetical protein
MSFSRLGNCLGIFIDDSEFFSILEEGIPQFRSVRLGSSISDQSRA